MNPINGLLIDKFDIWTSAVEGKKSGRGRSIKSMTTSYGVNKLRGLILECAIRGKLVSQDNTEEPASELLKKIEHEGAISNQSSSRAKKRWQLDTTHEKIVNKLPVGWSATCLGDVVEIIRGITFPGNEKSKTKEPGRIACLRTSNVQNQIDWDDLLYIGEDFISRDDQILRPKDIVMSMANSRELVGKVALVDSLPEKTTFGGFLGVIRSTLISPEFLMIFLRAPSTRTSLIESSSQTTNIANISLAKLNPLFFAAPPLAEQCRIVEEVNKLFILCDQLESKTISADTAHQILVKNFLSLLAKSDGNKEFISNWGMISGSLQDLFDSPESVQALKHALLELALMGRLVPQDVDGESTTQLLKQIQDEKSRLVTEGFIKKEKPLPPVRDSEKYFPLPRGWEWTRLQAVIDVRDGTHDSPRESMDANSVPLVTSKDFSGGEINFAGAKRISAADHEEISKRSFVEKFDILFSMIGGNIGNQVMVSTDQPFSIKNVALFKYWSKELTNPFFIKKYSEYLASKLQDSAVGGAQPFVALGQLRALVIALPPKQEQQKIVEKLDELLFLCDKLEKHLEESNRLEKKIADVLVEQALA